MRTCAHLLTNYTNITPLPTDFACQTSKYKAQLKIVISTTSLRQPLTGLGHYTLNLIQSLQSATSNELLFFDGTQWTDIATVKSQRLSFNTLSILRKLPFAYQAKRFLGELSFRRGIQKKGLISTMSQIFWRTKVIYQQ